VECPGEYQLGAEDTVEPVLTVVAPEDSVAEEGAEAGITINHMVEGSTSLVEVVIRVLEVAAAGQVVRAMLVREGLMIATGEAAGSVPGVQEEEEAVDITRSLDDHTDVTRVK